MRWNALIPVQIVWMLNTTPVALYHALKCTAAASGKYAILLSTERHCSSQVTVDECVQESVQSWRQLTLHCMHEPVQSWRWLTLHCMLKTVQSWSLLTLHCMHKPVQSWRLRTLHCMHEPVQTAEPSMWFLLLTVQHSSWQRKSGGRFKFAFLT